MIMLLFNVWEHEYYLLPSSPSGSGDSHSLCAQNDNTQAEDFFVCLFFIFLFTLLSSRSSPSHTGAANRLILATGEIS